jgi:hypothetical protein
VPGLAEPDGAGDVAVTAQHGFNTHGFDPSPGPITLRFGSHLASSGGQVREVRSGTDVTSGKGFDLALIRFPAVTGIRPLPLVSKDDSNLYKNGAVGWGGTAGGKLATQLQPPAGTCRAARAPGSAEAGARPDHQAARSPGPGQPPAGDHRRQPG